MIQHPEDFRLWEERRAACESQLRTMNQLLIDRGCCEFSTLRFSQIFDVSIFFRISCFLLFKANKRCHGSPHRRRRPILTGNDVDNPDV